MRIRAYDGDGSAPPPQIAQTASSRGDVAQVRRDADAQMPASVQTSSSKSALPDRSSAARAREERYRALLQSAPPAGGTPSTTGGTPATNRVPPVQKPAAPPTLLDRVVKPIAGALGLNRSAASSQERGRPEPQPPSKTETVDQNAERDEDSDVTPPRLLAAEFTPMQVQDGDPIVFIATVTDDISGVKSVSGVIVSPSGAQQGFGCQRDENGRFVARINIPKEAAEGTWTVKYLTLTDNAGNTTSITAGQGLPQTSFRVVSAASDSIGPVLKAAWLDQQSMSAGEKNQVFVQADDDKSGVNLVSGVFVSPSKQARIGFGCRLSSANLWQCPVSPPTCVDCGSWQLEQIQLQDKANNMTTVRADNPLVANVKLQLFGKECDNTPPVLTAVTLEPLVVSNKEGGVIRVTAVATDDQCGVASLSGVAMQPPVAGSSTRLYFPFRPVEGDTFVGEIPIPKHAPSGIWTIGWIQAIDKGHNLKAYPSNDPILARVIFRVE